MLLYDSLSMLEDKSLGSLPRWKKTNKLDLRRICQRQSFLTAVIQALSHLSVALGRNIDSVGQTDSGISSSKDQAAGDGKDSSWDTVVDNPSQSRDGWVRCPNRPTWHTPVFPHVPVFQFASLHSEGHPRILWKAQRNAVVWLQKSISSPSLSSPRMPSPCLYAARPMVNLNGYRKYSRVWE